MADTILKEIDHDSGGAVSAHYTDGVTDTDTRASISGSAALDSSTNGLALSVGASEAEVILEEATTASGTDKFGFTVFVDPNSVSGTSHTICEVGLYSTDAGWLSFVGSVALRLDSGGAYKIFGTFYDGLGANTTAQYTVTDAEHEVYIEVVKESSASGADGTGSLTIDGDFKETVSSVENFELFALTDEVRFHAAATPAGTSGSIYVDDLIYDDALGETTFSYDLVVSAGGLAKEAMATDTDGTYVFIALEDDSTGNQGVFRVVRPTTGAPTVTNVYDPVGGSAGNVAMTPDPDTMVFYGNFGTDKGVTVHTVSSGANADASPSSIGSDVIAPLRVDPADVDHWIAVNVDDQDGLETEDGGSNWTTLNSALGQTVEAMAAMFFGAYFPASVWIGGDDATDENLAYSPNDLNNTREDTSAGLKAVTKITGIDVIPDYGN